MTETRPPYLQPVSEDFEAGVVDQQVWALHQCVEALRPLEPDAEMEVARILVGRAARHKEIRG